MSSYYTAAQLEAMRQAKLKQELSDSLQRLSAQLREEHRNTTKSETAGGGTITVTAEDAGSSGYRFTGSFGEAMRNNITAAAEKRTELNFSSLLVSKKKSADKVGAALEEWLGRMEERPLLTPADQETRERVLAEIEKIKNDALLSPEDRIGQIRMRVTSYLQGARKLSKEDREKLESELFLYRAMCEMAGEEAPETAPYRVSREIRRLSELLEKRQREEYIAASMNEIMSELGFRMKDAAVMDHVEGQLYTPEGSSACDVFVGLDGSGIMFEPVAESRGGSLEKKRQIESSANRICAKYEKVEELAAERGIILRRVYLEPASAESICVQSDLSESAAKKSQRKTRVKQERYMTTEG